MAEETGTPLTKLLQQQQQAPPQQHRMSPLELELARLRWRAAQNKHQMQAALIANSSAPAHKKFVEPDHTNASERMQQLEQAALDELNKPLQRIWH